MKHYIALFFATLWLATSFQASAANKTTIRLNLQKGESYELIANVKGDIVQEMMGQKVEMEQNMTISSIMNVTDKLADGNFAIEYRYKAIRMDVKGMGQAFRFDSESPDKSSPIYPIFEGMINGKLQLVVTPLGKIVKAEGFESLLKGVNANPQIAEALKPFNNADGFKTNFEQTFGYFTDKETEQGDVWSNTIEIPNLGFAKITTDFQAVSITDNQLDITMKAIINTNGELEQNGIKIDMAIEGNQAGTLDIERKTGLFSVSDVLMKLKINMKFKNPATGDDMTMPMEINSTTKTLCRKL